MPSPPRRPGRTPPHRGPPRANRARRARRAPAARPLPALLAVALLGAQLAATGLPVLGAAPGAPPRSLAAAAGGASRTAPAGGTPPAVAAPAGYPDPPRDATSSAPSAAGRAGRRLTEAIPDCGIVTVTSDRCDFKTLNAELARMQLYTPTVRVVDVLPAAAMTEVPQAYRGPPAEDNGLRQVLKNTFNANPAKPVSYLKPPVATVSAKPRNGGPPVTATGSLSKSIEKSVQSQGRGNAFRYKLQRGGDNDDFGILPAGKCEVVISGPCTCPAPPTPPPPTCTYADITCIAGDNCPEGTLVSAACADRSAFNENPCACTALQELAALSAANLAGQAPWSNLATASYCTLDSGNYPVSEPHWIAVPVSGGRAERLTDWRAGCSTTLTTTIWISTSGARWSTVWSCPMSVSVAG